jgi:two-component system chemotaxis response regulator CheB
MNSLIVIGASTGGPEALAAILCGLPKDFSVPFVVVQHILPDFTGTFAKRLDKKCNLVVREGEQGDILKPGHVYMAPSDKHLVFRHGKIDLDDGPLVNFVKPSVDVTMKSAARLFRKNAIGIILTGSGSDGTVCPGQTHQCDFRYARKRY